MRATLKEAGNQLLSLIRLIAFVPVAYAGGILARMLFKLLITIATLGLVKNFDGFWDGPQIWIGVVGWIVTYYISAFIKPKFITPKIFIISWSAVIGLFAAVTVNMYINPPSPYYQNSDDVFKTLIPIGVLVWFVKDKEKGIHSLDANNKEGGIR